jgi:hypothetical protein
MGETTPKPAASPPERKEVNKMSEKEKISGEKLAENLKYLSDFDKGYFLGKGEARAEQRKEEAHKDDAEDHPS